MMNSYFEQKEKIKKDKFVELKYEDLISNPIDQVNRIYSTLHLPGFEDVLPKMKKYLKNNQIIKPRLCDG